MKKKWTFVSAVLICNLLLLSGAQAITLDIYIDDPDFNNLPDTYFHAGLYLLGESQWDSDGSAFTHGPGYHWGTDWDMPAPPCSENGLPDVYAVGHTGFSVHQLLEEIYQPETTYTLSCVIGDPFVNEGFPSQNLNWTLQLYVWDEQSETRIPVASTDFQSSGIRIDTYDTWHEISLVYTTGTSDDHLGERIGIDIYDPNTLRELASDCFKLTGTSDTYCQLNMSTNFAETSHMVSPAVGTHYYLGPARTITVSAIPSAVICPDLYEFSNWTGNVANTGSVTTTIDLTTGTPENVQAVYTKTASSCASVSMYILNHRFEIPDITPGDDRVWPVPGWNGNYWVEDAPVSGNPASYFNSFPDPTGQQYIKVYADGDEIIQELFNTYQANGTYTLTMDVGQGKPFVYWYDDWYIRLTQFDPVKGAEVILAEANQSTDGEPALGGWISVSCNVTMDDGTDPCSVVDLPIRIVMGGENNVCFDNVTLTGTGLNETRNLTTAADPPALGGFIEPTPGTVAYPYGAVVLLDADSTVVNCPDTYSFNNWGGDVNLPDPESEEPTTVTMNKDQNVTAEYVIDNLCADDCHPLPPGDYSVNCIVNLGDVGTLGERWGLPGEIPVPCGGFECGVFGRINDGVARPWYDHNVRSYILTEDCEYGESYCMPQAACNPNDEIILYTEYGEVFQVVPNTIYEPNEIYILTAAVATVSAAYPPHDSTDYVLKLYYVEDGGDPTRLADQVVLAQGGKDELGVTPIAGVWQDVSLSYQCTDPAAFGKEVGIYLGGIGGVSGFLVHDCARLFSTQDLNDWDEVAEIHQNWLTDNRP